MKMTRRFWALAILAAALSLFGAGSAAAAEVPGPVSELRASSRDGSVTVSWQEPSIGGAPNRYIVHLKPVDGGRGKIRRPKAGRTQITFGNLERGTTYRISVRGRNAAGKGERTHVIIEAVRMGYMSCTSEGVCAGTRPIPQDVWDEISPRP